MTELIRDSKGKVIGKTSMQGRKTVLFDGTGKQLGYYDPSTKSTFTASGQLVARTNILMSLLKFN